MPFDNYFVISRSNYDFIWDYFISNNLLFMSVLLNECLLELCGNLESDLISLSFPKNFTMVLPSKIGFLF